MLRNNYSEATKNFFWRKKFFGCFEEFSREIEGLDWSEAKAAVGCGE